MSSLLTAVLAGAGGMLGWGLADFFAKKTIDRIGDIATLALAHVFGTVLLLAIVLASWARGTPHELPTSASTWMGLGFYGALQAAVYLLVYRGFAKGQLALLNPVFASYSGLTALLSILVLREPAQPFLLLPLLLIFAGVILLNLDLTSLGGLRVRLTAIPGFREVAAAALLAAVWTLGWDRFVSGRDWLVYATVMYGAMTAVVLIAARLKRVKLMATPRAAWKYLVLIGVFETGAYLAVSWGLAATPHTSVVALLSGAFSLPTIVLARLFLGERTTATQAFASLVIVAGIVLVAAVRF